MRNSIILLFIGLFISITSCRTDFDTVPSTGSLEFSKDTVYLDTVFTNIGSSTYQLKVYNRSDNNIRIPKIELGKGQNSKYRITVDGLVGTNNRTFENVELLANDSLYIFIETTAGIADANPSDFLYTDEILFDVGTNQQKVNLVTLIQDAIFIKPNRSLPDNIKETLILSGNQTALVGHELNTESELNWTNEKPYVVYGYALVPNGKTLNIGAGTKVHFHADSGIVVDKQGILNVNGELSTYDSEGNTIVDNEVRFEGDRLEPLYEDIPGQWGFVLIMSEATSNIKHLTLKNASIGLYVIPLDIDAFYEAKVNIINSQIYNCSNLGLYSIGAKIDANNLVINNCGNVSLACTCGGNYNFTHCTINNNWNNTTQKAVFISNYYEDSDGAIYLADLDVANFTNSIIYGSNQVELQFDKKTDVSTLFNFKFNNCLIRFNNSQLNNTGFYQFNDITHYENCKIATNSTLFNPEYSDANNNKLWPTVDLDAIIPPFLPTTPLDILGKARTNIGAYQFIAE